MKKQLTIIAFILFPVIAVIANHEIISAVLAISWLFIIIPICLLYIMDWFRANESHNTFSKVVRNIMRMPIAILGAISIVMGVAIILWVLYNIFINRQVEYTGPSTILGGFGVGPSLVLFGYYLVRLAVSKQVKEEDLTYQ